MTPSRNQAISASEHAAQRTRKFLNSPIRIGVPAIVMAVLLALLSLIQADIIPGIWGWPAAIVAAALFSLIAIAMNQKARPGRRPGALSEPFRSDPNNTSFADIAPVFMAPAAILLGDVATELIPQRNTTMLVVAIIVIALIITGLIMLPQKFGFAPLASSLPDDFATRYAYSPDSVEAAVLAVLHVGGAPRRVAFRDCLPYFTSLDDAALTEALHRLAEDGLIRVSDNNSALTQKSRNRQLVQLVAAA